MSSRCRFSMIEISSAVSSSISSMSAGMEASPARRDARQRRSPATFARDDLVLVRTDRPDEDRLQDAVLTDRRGQFLERVLLEDDAWLLRIGVDAIDRDDPDADAARR